MPNTINLRLLDSKNIIAEMQGIPLGNENSYKIIAGEENATVFKIVSKPNQYVNARYTVEMVNSQGYGVIVPDLELVEEGKVEAYIENDTFQLPVGMAVSGYGYILIRGYFNNEEGKKEVVPFMVLKIKIWKTLSNWKDYISEGSGGNIDLTPYQKKTDETLETESKEIVGAINEVNTKLTESESSFNSKLDKKLDKKTAEDNIYTRAYCFNQNEQTERFICTGEESGGIFVGALAAYDSNVCLRQNATPTLNNQVANKSYVDSAINTAVKSTIDTDLTSTTAWLMLLKNTRYVRGTLTELTLNFSTEGTFTDGDQIVIEFISGSTATTVTRDTTNAIYNFSTVGANKFVELNAEYKASIGKWVVLSAETPYTAS